MNRNQMVLLLLFGCPQPGTDTDTDDTDSEDTDANGLPPPAGDAATVELLGACPLATKVGSFSVSDVLISGQPFTVVEGAVLDGVVPVDVLTSVGTAGDCELLRRENPYCDGGCASDQTCDLGGHCVPYPGSVEVGQVTIAGLVEDVVMDPIQPGSRYFYNSLPNPAFHGGDLVQLRGGGAQAFDLHGVGVEALEGLSDTWVLQEGEPLLVSWTASSTRARVDLQLTIDQHGTSPIKLVCSFEDDGEGTVPSALVRQLITAGVTGFPNGTLSRRTLDQAQIASGCVDFGVRSTRSPDVRVAGYIPCTQSQQCPQGLSCNTELELCE